MKTLIFISLLSIFGAAKISSPLTLPVSVKGYIRSNPDDSSWNINHLRVFVKGDNKILAKTFTNHKGYFEITFTPKSEKSFDFYCTSGKNTLLIGSYTSFESDNPKIFFNVPVKFLLDKNGYAICPKCKQADKTLKIIMSQPPGYYDLVKQGVIDTSIHHRGVYHCSRDKVSF